MVDLNVKPIDVHIHPFTEETRLGHGPSYTEAHDDYFGNSPDAPHHDKLSIAIDESAETFKKAGIDKAILVNMVSYHKWGRALPNDYIAQYCEKYPDIFLGLGGIDPHIGAKAAVTELERCMNDLNLLGLKFHPAYQEVDPADKELMYPILEACEAMDAIVLIHTGTTRMTYSKIRTCNPISIDDIATDFPKLKIIMTHFGWPWTAEALAVIWRHENVYLDLSGWLPKYIYQAEPIVFHYMNSILSDKFVYGSDYPAIDPTTWIDDFMEIVKNGYVWGNNKKEFRQEAIDNFFRQNAVKLLGLDK